MLKKLFGNKNKVSSISSGSHGDHWSAIFGFKTFSENKMGALDI